MSSPDNNGLSTELESVDAPETGIVPVVDANTRETALMWMGYVWCILAGAFAPSFAILASVLGGYGTLVLSVVRDTRTALTATVIGFVAAAVASLPIGTAAIPQAIITLFAAYVIGAGLGSGKLTSGGVCLLCVLVALAMLGIDSSFATWAGTTLHEAALAQIDASVAAVSANVEGLEEGLKMAGDILRVIWPSNYTFSAIAGAVAAAIGARVARNGLGARAPRTLTLTTFDLPIWVAGILLVSIVGMALSQAVPAGDVVFMVSANLAMAARFAFGFAGIAVAAWILRKRGTGLLVTSLVCAVLVFIDLQFFVMAIVGLIDFWANFRRLPRGANAVTARV